MKKTTLSLLVTLLLTGCAGSPDVKPEPKSIWQETTLEAQKKEPNSGDEKPVAPVFNRQDSGVRFNVSANEESAKKVFHTLSELSNTSIVLHGEVTEPVTLNLRDVTIEQSLRTLQRMYGYDISKDGNVFIVKPPQFTTHTIQFNHLSLQRAGKTHLSVNANGVGASQEQKGKGQNNSNNQANSFSDGTSGRGNSTLPSTILSSDKTNDVTSNMLNELSEMVKGFGEGRTFSFERESGVMSIRAYPHEIVAVNDFVNAVESQLKRQVVLDVKIIEVGLSKDFQAGVNWDNIIASAGSTSFGFSTSKPSNTVGNDITNQLGGAMALTISNADFNGVLRVLDTQGDTNVLSSPRIMATNNQKAVIKVGSDEFFVTDVSSTTVVGAGASSQTPSLTLSAFFSGISLDITPQISADGEVMLHVAPSVVETLGQNKSFTVDGKLFSLPLAKSQIRQADTVISAQSGDIVVIGGLMRKDIQDETTSVPVVSAIPLVGALFRSEKKVERNQELIILVRPIVIEPPSFNDSANKSLWGRF